MKLFKLLNSAGNFYESQSPGTIGGHLKLKIYGQLNCPSALRFINKGHYVKHRVFFADESTAIAAGYRPCAKCMKEKYLLWKSETEKIKNNDQSKKVSDLFRESPAQWGLRGDPFLWDDLSQNLQSLAWPDSEDKLRKILHQYFHKLTGVTIFHEEPVFLEKYSYKGMSSGYIHAETWRDKIFPQIITRFHEMNIEGTRQPSPSYVEEQHDRETIKGSNFTIYIGDVDLSKGIVTIQRGTSLVAAVQDRGDGKLLTSVYQSLCDKSLKYLMGLSMNQNGDGTVCMRANNWEYALDCSAGMGNVYACDAGQAYLSLWEYGLGVLKDGEKVSEWVAQTELEALSPLQVRKYFDKFIDPLLTPTD